MEYSNIQSYYIIALHKCDNQHKFTKKIGRLKYKLLFEVSVYRFIFCQFSPIDSHWFINRWESVELVVWCE